MAVSSLKNYKFASRDHVSNFNGNQLVYTSWDHHLLFAAPFITCVSPDMKFAEYIEQSLRPLLWADPDFEQIDWDAIQWFKGNEVWKPNFEASLKDNGVTHKAHLRMHTPGLNTLMPQAAQE